MKYDLQCKSDSCHVNVLYKSICQQCDRGITVPTLVGAYLPFQDAHIWNISCTEGDVYYTIRDKNHWNPPTAHIRINQFVYLKYHYVVH